MKTPEEIKKGLECGFCHECPYDNNELETVEECSRQVLKDAIAYITQLEQRLAQAERERDAAVADLSDSCRHCRFVKEEQDDSHCDGCIQRDGKYLWSPMVRTKFEWRGVCSENTKEERKAEDCRYYTTKCSSGGGCIGTKEIDPCKGDNCEQWKPKGALLDEIT